MVRARHVGRSAQGWVDGTGQTSVEMAWEAADRIMVLAGTNKGGRRKAWLVHYKPLTYDIW